MLDKVIALLLKRGTKKEPPKMGPKAPAITVSDLARFQVEAEYGIRAIDTMTSFYQKRNGDVEEGFAGDCIVLMNALKGAIERLASVERAAQAKQGEPNA